MNKPPRKSTKKKSASAQSPTALPSVNPAGADHVDPERSLPFQIVGIGASAGGIEALTHLFTALPSDTGMAFVVVQHLDPTHESMIAEIVGRTTPLTTQVAGNHMPVEPNNIYIIPPGKDMVFGDGVLQLSPRTELRGQHRSIDQFLRSLAKEHGHKAIAVILSGMGNDGTLGVEEIKGGGGITFAQDNSAEHSSMPRSAIASGCIDMVLSPAEIAREIGRISQHPLLVNAPPTTSSGKQEAFEQILQTLHDVVGMDFSNYKRNTLHRRVTRRMVLHKFDDMERYAQYVRAHPKEAEALYSDILINVTSFFRDPEAYELLKSRVFPALTENRSRQESVRVWALGCSTGEEAYSLAMAYVEFAEASGRRTPIQIFATDLNAAGIEKARSGTYSKGIEQDVSPERLRRFFTDIEGRYRISKSIRDMCIFARQNVLSDPPFSRMDLIACRNVLIYLDPVLQQRLMPMLHYALRNHGFLWLGTSETVGAYRDLFEQQDARYKLYVKKPGATRSAYQSPTYERPLPPHAIALAKAVPARETSVIEHNREADRILLSRYAPPAVVLTRDLEILQFRGDTAPYLAPVPGRASLSVLKMLREGLAPAVSRAVQTALQGKTAREEGLRVRSNGGYRELAIEVMPINSPGRDGEALLLLFHDGNGVVRPLPEPAPVIADSDAQQEIERLRDELNATREYLQSLIEQQDAANEELQSANEEVQSANEELQSTNEELETSKEEIQSANEELETINDEFQARNLELAQTNNDLLNVLGSANVPMVIIGRDLLIRRVTPSAERMLNLMPTDIGRPIGDIKMPARLGDLQEMLLDVIDTMVPCEREGVHQDTHFLLRARPYKTIDNKIDGAVLVFHDINATKQAEAALLESEARFALLANSTPALIWVSGPEGLQYANTTAIAFFGVEEKQLKRYDWTQFIHPGERADYLKRYLECYVQRERCDAQLRLLRADGEYRWMNAVALPRSSSTPTELFGYTVCCTDITELKQAEALLRDADALKNRFIAVLGHELRNPLGAVRNSVEAINLSKRDATVMQRALEVIERQTTHMARIVDDLLDISRITHGLLTLHKTRIDVVSAVRQAIEATEHMRRAAGQSLHADLPPQPVWVEADAVRLGQVFSNLLVNASKFTNAGGNIRVIVSTGSGSAEATANSVSICIIDDGVGVNPAMLDRIFELFVQGDMPSSSRAKGMGLGLPLSRQLIELHGGTIRANSEGEGKGLEVVIHLPTIV